MENKSKNKLMATAVIQSKSISSAINFQINPIFSNKIHAIKDANIHIYKIYHDQELIQRRIF